LIHWHRERKKRTTLRKVSCAGGQLPSGKFGAHAAWWQIMILALPKELKTKSLKGLRFYLINLHGQVIAWASFIAVCGGILWSLKESHPWIFFFYILQNNWREKLIKSKSYMALFKRLLINPFDHFV
jgi:hypothetical protein